MTSARTMPSSRDTLDGALRRGLSRFVGELAAGFEAVLEIFAEAGDGSTEAARPFPVRRLAKPRPCRNVTPASGPDWLTPGEAKPRNLAGITRIIFTRATAYHAKSMIRKSGFRFSEKIMLLM